MSQHAKFKNLALYSVAALFAAGQAFAHTGVRDKTVNEGDSSYNGFTITHGCQDYNQKASTSQYPVIGQSAVFPRGDYAVWRDANSTFLGVGGTNNGTISGTSLDLKVTGYASFSSPFVTSQEIVDENGNVMALLWKDGAMAPNLNAVTPFKITAPTIADNCVKSLKIRIGVINYCDTNKNADNDNQGPWKAPKDAFGHKIPFTTVTPDPQKNVQDSLVYKSLGSGNGDNNRADWWFRDLYYPNNATGTVYIDDDILSEDGLWSATLTVNNSAADIAQCGGTPVDLIVEPSGAAFETFLSGANTRPFTKGDTNL